jgi:predicted DNA-binding protein with PD1-like motif
VHVFEVKNGDELMTSIEEQAKEAGVLNGAIVSLIGAADDFAVSTMPEGDATRDIVTTYELPAEMSGTGEIVDGQVHIHVVMAVEGDEAVSGHLHYATIKTHFARAYVLS